MTHADEYRSRLMSAGDAVRGLQPGAHMAMGMATAEPPALLGALADLAEQGDIDDIKLWYFHSMDHAAETVLRPDLLGRIRPRCMFLSAIERKLLGAQKPGTNSPVEFVPVAFSDSPRLFEKEVSLDLFVTTVSPMDKHGWFTFGTSNDYSTAAARNAKKLVVEVNPYMPRVFGASLLHVSEVDAIVENTMPIVEVQAPETSLEEAQVAAIIADMIDDRACLQMGIGALPGAVCALLRDRRDMGIHTELMTPALAGLIQCGAVTNQAKTTYRGRSVFTFAMGDRPFYDFLDDNPAMHSAPVNIVNDPRHIAKTEMSFRSTLRCRSILAARAIRNI
ncbi:acetyl-CoA hydrolase/transferase family protein [Sphingopyxis sp. BSNA05]|uniref:acetyl-CoA hydrolase/transferase family protein n=1 Tax=Sphingopyxis sp. BSNA05 TaxID=1236614 RepID=UPI00349F82B9